MPAGVRLLGSSEIALRRAKPPDYRIISRALPKIAWEKVAMKFFAFGNRAAQFPDNHRQVQKFAAAASITALAIVTVLSPGQIIWAATKTWGDGSSNWSNASFWVPAGVPVSGDVV